MDHDDAQGMELDANREEGMTGIGWNRDGRSQVDCFSLSEEE